MTKTPLPNHLFQAYNWTAAAGELDELRTLTGDALDTYCRESAENCASEDVGDVTVDDLHSLHVWLAKAVR